MPQSNKEITSKTLKYVNGQLVEIEKQKLVRVMTDDELSRLRITRSKTPTPKFQWFTRFISGINLFFTNRRG